MDTRPPLIVVGAGLAGWTAVREFRKHDRSTPVIVVTADDGDFCAKPSLSNAFAQGKAPAQLISTPAARMVESLQVTLPQRAVARAAWQRLTGAVVGRACECASRRRL